MTKRDRRGALLIRGYAHSGDIASMRLSGILSKRNEVTFLSSIEEDLVHGCRRFLICIGKECFVADDGCKVFQKAYEEIRKLNGKLVVIDLNNQCRGKSQFKVVTSIKEGFRIYKMIPRVM